MVAKGRECAAVAADSVIDLTIAFLFMQRFLGVLVCLCVGSYVVHVRSCHFQRVAMRARIFLHVCLNVY